MSQNASKFNRIRVNNILEVGRRDVLCQIFAWGTPNKSAATPLDQYMPNRPLDKKGNLLPVSKIFNADELKKIPLDPTCTTFDISLLWKAIKLACDGVANYNDEAWYTPSTTMEYFITVLKDERNNSMHGKREITTQDFLDTATRLRQLFRDALCAAKIRYTRSDAELDLKIKEVYQKCDEIMREVLGEEDLLTFRGPQLKPDLVKETNEALNKHLEDSCNIDPMSFLTDTRLHLQVQKVFTEVKVTRGRVRGERQSLRYQDLVEAARTGPRPAQPQVLLVEGIAGSGKTTFVKLVTDEWLKDANDRTITGLDYYDLLLRVQCRERKITSLNCLLENEVPRVFLKFRDLILPVIKNCKTLILLDGVDECNEDSEKLIDDVLAHMKCVAGCTLLFTSRPEGVTSFISRIPKEYQVSYIELIGIPESHRELFVRRYHEEIKQQIGDTQDTEKLVEKVREVLQMEHFRLPLNMVFLTWVYIHEPSAITFTTTQTQLYHSTYQLCLQKLLDRLARHSTTRSSDRQTLETCLKQPMEQVQYESLLALWRSQLTFEPEAVENIKASCTDQGIPHKELLSAFLTLKANRTHLGILVEQYSAPHKGLQDFYAALHIINHHRLTTSSGNIRGVLEEALGKLGKKLRRLGFVLYLVAGLLHLLPSTVLQTVSEEVVDMLHESGLRKRDQWLDLVEDTRANPAVVRRVASYFAAATDMYESMELFHEEDEEEEEEEQEEGKMEKEEREKREMEKRKKKKRKERKKVKVDGKKSNEKELQKGRKTTAEGKNSDANNTSPSFAYEITPLEISETRIESFIALLPLLPSCETEIRFNKDPGPRVDELVNALNHHICTKLFLLHHYKNSDLTATSDQFLQQVLHFPRSRLRWFRGLLTEDSIRLLPRSIQNLDLVLTDDDHATRTLTALHSVCHQLPSLTMFNVHVPVGKVTSSCLSPAIPSYLNGKVLVSLTLSGVNDQLIEEACRMAKALQCPRAYDYLMFPGASLSNEECRKLLEGLVEARVRVNGYVLATYNGMNIKMVDELNTLARDKLGCRFSRVVDGGMWTL